MERKQSTEASKPPSKGGTTRRTYLAAACAALTAPLAGCVDVATGERPLTYTASPARVRRRALDATGFEAVGVRRRARTRTYEALGVRRRVRLVDVVSTYDRGIELGPLGRLRAAVFAVRSSPRASTLGYSFNPLGEKKPDELAAAIDRHYRNVRNVRTESEWPVTVLGTDTRLTRYTAQALLLDGRVVVDVYLYVSEVVRSGEDFVVCVAAHPRALDESEAVRRLAAAIRHEGAD